MSEFITSFPQLESESNVYISYNVTVAHRQTELSLLNSGIVDPLFQLNTSLANRIENCSFATIPGKNLINLSKFDQVWLFGIDNSAAGNLTPAELTAFEVYMNAGGGLFATGDHGNLGKSLCGSIIRVKDMRLWDNTDPANDLNEVSMTGMRRNDTNRPGIGQTVSNQFNNQSDAIPQNIAPRVFSAGMPHALLSISTTKRASGIIDIMPDHPHEGECRQESIFTVNGQNIRSQLIATSFVLAGSTTNGGVSGKTPTLAHCFPSIHVFDGRPANVGRVVVDSTWHHFVNINLGGFTNSDFDVIQQYYMNIAKWIAKPKNMLCRLKYILPGLFLNSQLIESSLNDSRQKVDAITLKDLGSIGSLAEEVLAEMFTPVEAKQILLDLVQTTQPELAKKLDAWRPQIVQKANAVEAEDLAWIDFDKIGHIGIGAGFIALRDSGIFAKEFTEKSVEKMISIFSDGINYGVERSLKNFSQHAEGLSALLAKRK